MFRWSIKTFKSLFWWDSRSPSSRPSCASCSADPQPVVVDKPGGRVHARALTPMTKGVPFNEGIPFTNVPYVRNIRDWSRRSYSPLGDPFCTGPRFDPWRGLIADLASLETPDVGVPPAPHARFTSQRGLTGVLGATMCNLVWETSRRAGCRSPRPHARPAAPGLWDHEPLGVGGGSSPTPRPTEPTGRR